MGPTLGEDAVILPPGAGSRWRVVEAHATGMAGTPGRDSGARRAALACRLAVCLLVATAVALRLPATADPASSRPAAGCLAIPPDWEERVVYYDSLAGDAREAAVNRVGLEVVRRLATDSGAPVPAATGVRGLELRGPALSPHRPLAVSFWWRLLRDADRSSGFGLVHLQGSRGYVAHFARSGPWCGLEQPAGVLQVYSLPGVQNQNGIYDRELMSHQDLRAGVWHHTAVVWEAGTLVTVYSDGGRAHQTRLLGRPFQESDRLQSLFLGGGEGLPLEIAEVMVLNRPLLAPEVATYVRALRQMHSAGYQVGPWRSGPGV